MERDLGGAGIVAGSADRQVLGELAGFLEMVRGRLFETSSGIPVQEVPEDESSPLVALIRSPIWLHKRM